MSDSPKLDVRALAELSRIRIAEEEIPKLEEELSGILSFVEEIQRVEVGDAWREEKAHRNIMRADTEGYEPGMYTDALLNAAPKRSGDYLEVKQVLGHVKKDASDKS